MKILDWLFGKRTPPYAHLKPLADHLERPLDTLAEGMPILQQLIRRTQYSANSYRFALNTFPDGDPKDVAATRRCADTLTDAYVAMDAARVATDNYIDAMSRLIATMRDIAQRTDV